MKNRIATILRGARERRGESQADVARRMGVSQQIISRIERGAASFERILEYCRFLGLRVELRMDRRKITLVHPIDPEERKEIEANIAWFSRLKPKDRLKAIDLHVRADERLKKAMKHGR